MSPLDPRSGTLWHLAMKAGRQLVKLVPFTIAWFAAAILHEVTSPLCRYLLEACSEWAPIVVMIAVLTVLSWRRLE